jgi:predicted MFS family arabinose efflux permease
LAGGGRVAVLVLLTTSGIVNIQLLIASVPLASARLGGPLAAGAATVVLTAGMVAIQLAMPSLLARHSYRALMVAGLLLLGVPSILHLWTTGLAALLALTLVRGIGAGIVTVISTILIVRYGEPARRGSDFGVFATWSGVVAVVGPPIGLAALDVVGLGALGLIAGAISVAGAAATVALMPEPQAEPAARLWALVVSTWRRLVRPIGIFATAMCGFAVLHSFLPAWSTEVATPALLLVGIGSACSRLVAGRLVDRFRPHALLLPGLGIAAVAMTLIALGVAEGSEPFVLAGSLAFGSGVGVLIVSSYLTLIWQTADAAHPALASFWNAMYDSGLLVGGLAFSPVAALLGYQWMFAGCAVLLLGVFCASALGSPREWAEAAAPPNAPVAAVLHGDLACKEHPLDP